MVGGKVSNRPEGSSASGLIAQPTSGDVAVSTFRPARTAATASGSPVWLPRKRRTPVLSNRKNVGVVITPQALATRAPGSRATGYCALSRAA